MAIDLDEVAQEILYNLEDDEIPGFMYAPWTAEIPNLSEEDANLVLTAYFSEYHTARVLPDRDNPGMYMFQIKNRGNFSLPN